MSTAPRSLFRIRYRTAILWLAVAMIVWSGFSYWAEYSENSARRARELLAPPIGVNCLVNLVGSAEGSVSGKLVDQSDRWIVVEEVAPPDRFGSRGRRTWIPRERVELILIDP